MPRCSISKSARIVASPAAPESGPCKLLQKSKLRYLQQLGPLLFVNTVEKMNRFYGFNRRLCLISGSLLTGVCASSGELSFCIPVEDVSEVIIDTSHLAMGIRVRDEPFRTDAGRNKYAEMPVDVLLNAPTLAVLNEFVDALARVYRTRTEGHILAVRERFMGESLAATLTLRPEGRRVRKFAPLAAGSRAAPPPTPLFSRASTLVVEYPTRSQQPSPGAECSSPLADGYGSVSAVSRCETGQAFLPPLQGSTRGGLVLSPSKCGARADDCRPQRSGLFDGSVVRCDRPLPSEPSSPDSEGKEESRVTSQKRFSSDLDTENG